MAKLMIVFFLVAVVPIVLGFALADGIGLLHWLTRKTK